MFESRREILFIYSVKDGNPNGDPLNANHPRYDEETQQVMASDVRIKRTIRDQFIRDGEDVFIDGEAKTLDKRFSELKEKLRVENGKDAMKKCIDSRLFGVTFALGKEAFSWTGPVQFKWARSLNKAKVDFIQGTGGFAKSETSEQRTFRNEYKVPFALMAVYAIANQNSSKISDATDEDLSKMINALWNGTNNLITRSKTEHRSRFMLEIEYKPEFEGHIGALDEKLFIVNNNGNPLDEDEELALRSLKDFTVDISEIVEHVKKVNDNVKNVDIFLDPELKLKGFDVLEKLLGDKVHIEER
ncbi:MAG: type I-B CRISPR-associated protein Cas7/Csh2 [Athalassotoga sp.]